VILFGGNGKTRKKICPSATLSTTNPTWTDPGAIPGFRGERPATNRRGWHGPSKVSFWYVRSTLCFVVLQNR
jgi:hypothetical protein